MKIRQFEDRDLKEAEEIAYNYWSKEIPEENEKLKRMIYEYMVRYYDRNREFSFCIEDQDLKGFLLAFRKSDQNDHNAWLHENLRSFTTEEKALVMEYKAYFDYNGNKMKEHMHDNDIIIGLFISSEKGGGKILFQNLRKQCELQHIANVFLWTDTTCNYKYYYHNNFEEIARTNAIELFEDIDLETIIFKKQLYLPAV